MKIRILLAGLEDGTVTHKLLQLEKFLQELGADAAPEVLHQGCEAQLPLIRSWISAHPAPNPGEEAALTLVCSTDSGKRLGMAQAAAWGQDCHTGALGIQYSAETPMVRRKVYSTHLEALFPAGNCVLVLADNADIAPALPAGHGDAAIGIWNLPAAQTLASQQLVLLGGKGLGSRENFERLEALAEKLGAACACTRPVALSGWTDFGKVTGVSGWQLNAKVCITFGVSGAAPLLHGLENVGRIIAINNDKTASIFRYAQEGIVADCMEIIEELEALV